MLLHPDPPLLQRCHWYANEIVGVPPQLPLEAVSVWPWRAVPDTVGGEALTGADFAAAVTVGAAVADPDTATRAAAVTASPAAARKMCIVSLLRWRRNRR
jgi:hypothetical protein